MGFFQPFHRSELVGSSSATSADWKECGISLHKACMCAPETPLLVEVYKVDELTGRQDQRPDLLIGHCCLTFAQLETAGPDSNMANVLPVTTGHHQELQMMPDIEPGHRAAPPCYLCLPVGNRLQLTATRAPVEKEHTTGWLVLARFMRFFPQRATTRKELHLEDKHFAEDRQFLASLTDGGVADVGRQGAGGADSVNRAINDGARFIEECCQHWLVWRKAEQQQDEEESRKRRGRGGSGSQSARIRGRKQAPGRSDVQWDSSGRRIIEPKPPPPPSSDGTEVQQQAGHVHLDEVVDVKLLAKVAKHANTEKHQRGDWKLARGQMTMAVVIQAMADTDDPSRPSRGSGRGSKGATHAGPRRAVGGMSLPLNEVFAKVSSDNSLKVAN